MNDRPDNWRERLAPHHAREQWPPHRAMNWGGKRTRATRNELPPQERGDEGGPGRATERGLSFAGCRPGRTRMSDGHGSRAESCLIHQP
jgi:hypothetical protein